MMRLAAILLSVIVFSCSPVKKYESLPEVKAWEDDIREFEKLDKTETYPDDAILFTGSSSIRLWSTLKKDMEPYSVIQRGFGGSKLSDFVVYADRIVSPHPCSAIVIFIANDITGTEKDKKPAEVASLFRSALKTIRKSHPETPVFWIEITPTPSRWKVWSQVKEANSLIEEICDKQENTWFISTRNAFLSPEGTPYDGYFVKDMLHLNPEGYKVWKKIIKKEINKVVPYPSVEIIAHRGASFLAPENTVAAANLAWKLNADAVECDIHLTADQKVIVSHDANTKRTTGENMTIKNSHSANLRKLDAGTFKNESYKGEKMPLLEELIATVPTGKKLVVEIKSEPEIIPYLKKIIEAGKKDIQYDFIAFDFKTISLAKDAFPTSPCYWLCSDTALFQRNFKLIVGVNLDGVSLNFNMISREIADQVKDEGLELFTWTVDNPEDAKKMVELGVRGITTNKPDVIRKELGL